MARVLKNEVGVRYGSWTILEHIPRTAHKYWVLCRCDCGTEKPVMLCNLHGGATHGCLHCKGDRVAQHGATQLGKQRSEYKIWTYMRQRCSNPNRAGYHRYGGRGIKVCERWEGSYQAFIEDMGPRPSPKHSLDRIDNDGDYKKENCRWATREQQRNNCGNSRYLEHGGRRLTLTQWARELGMVPATLTKRFRDGWSVEKALTTPVDESHRTDRHGSPLIEYQGRRLTVREWALDAGIPERLLRGRLRMGWPMERALTEPTKNQTPDGPLTLTYQGQTKTLQQWAHTVGVEEGALRARFNRGWDAEAILTKPVRPMTPRSERVKKSG